MVPWHHFLLCNYAGAFVIVRVQNVYMLTDRKYFVVTLGQCDGFAGIQFDYVFHAALGGQTLLRFAAQVSAQNSPANRADCLCQGVVADHTAGNAADYATGQLPHFAIFGGDGDRAGVYDYALGHGVNMTRARCFVSVVV